MSGLLITCCSFCYFPLCLKCQNIEGYATRSDDLYPSILQLDDEYLHALPSDLCCIPFLVVDDFLPSRTYISRCSGTIGLTVEHLIDLVLQ